MMGIIVVAVLAVLIVIGLKNKKKIAEQKAAAEKAAAKDALSKAGTLEDIKKEG